MSTTLSRYRAKFYAGADYKFTRSLWRLLDFLFIPFLVIEELCPR